MNLNELKYKAAQVSDDMFGRDRPAIGPIKKLKDEVDELLECFEEDKDPSEEFADCFLILIDAYRKHFGDDVDLQKLIDDSSDKLDVVMKRIYKETVVEGVFQHIKEPVDTDLKYMSLINPGALDIDKIQKAYDQILDEVLWEVISSDLRSKIKRLMEEKLPEYVIKCDEENNPTEVIDAGNIWVKVSDKKTQNYVNLIL